MARYTKKRARELKHDAFRDATMSFFDRLGNRLEGKGRLIIYSVAAVVALAVLAGLYSWWSETRAEAARRALGKAIEIAEAPVSPSPEPGVDAISFPTERERAEAAVKEFQSVADEYGGRYKELARYFAAVNLLSVDPARGVSELEAVSRSAEDDIAARARFALAQQKEAEGKFDEAVALYNELLKEKEAVITPDTIKLRLAAIYEQQGKNEEAADLLFRLVEGARKAQGGDGKPTPQSAAAREAAQKLESLNPARYAQLPPEPRTGDLPF